MSNTTKTIISQAAVAYAQKELTPIIDKLNTLSENATTQNKMLAYHVFETCIIAKGEKVTHAMLEAAIDRPFDKRVSAKGRKVAAYVMNEKPCNGVTYSVEQFRTSKDGDKVIPAELHVMTVYGHIAAYEKIQRDTKSDTKSVVEQALAAAGLPTELADKQMTLAENGNDTAAAFVKSAMEKFTPAAKETASKDDEPLVITAEQALALALDALIGMVTEGESEAAMAWLASASELLTPVAASAETESEAIAA